ncbi:MAG: hypothetical protein ACOY46_11595 [Bacillota bacterium]
MARKKWDINMIKNALRALPLSQRRESRIRGKGTHLLKLEYSFKDRNVPNYTGVRMG